MTKNSFTKIASLILTGFAAMSLTGCSGGESKISDSAAKNDSAITADGNSATIEAESLTPQGNPLENAPGKIVNQHFVIAGKGPEIRAFTAFRSNESVSQPYIKLVNDFHKEFPDLNIYAIVIPGQAAYYTPKSVENVGKPMAPAFEYIKANLDPAVKFVDVYNTLGAHTKENIFLRTDHHWAPLGGYYTARELARVAGVPFKDLSEYDKHVVHGYVGSMFNYTGEQAIKDNPEDFVYYTPKGTDVTTTYVAVNTNKETGVTTESSPYKRDFFHHYSDGAGGAYCTFMGGDHYIVKVETGVPNGRRLLLIKDSHGNPIPAYLFHSFEEIHVIDYRYFTRNLRQYVKDNKISDIALAFGINTSSGSGNMQKVRDFINQSPGKKSAADKETSKTKKDSTEKKEKPDSTKK